VKVRAFDCDLQEFEIEGEGLLARAFCHELDHLEGKLYVDLVEGDLHEVKPYVSEEE
jgi:peptide deformylase